MYWQNKHLVSIFNSTRASNRTTNTPTTSVPSGISNSSWNLSETAKGHTGENIEFLGASEERMQEPQHGVSSLYALAKSFTTMSLYKRHLQRRPCLPPCTRALSSTSQLHLQTGLGRQVYISNSEHSVSRLAAFSGNKSNLQCVFSHWVRTWLLPSTHYFKTKLQQYLKMSNIVYKSSMLWRAYGSRKSFSRNVTELYFQPSCSMW